MSMPPQMQAQPRQAAREFESLEAELMAFIAASGSENEMPAFEAFRRAGRLDLALFVGRCGGRAAVAAYLGLEQTKSAAR